MNYIKLLNAAFEKFYFDDRLNPTHISLYMALFQEPSRFDAGLKNWVEIHLSPLYKGFGWMELPYLLPL